VLIVKIIKSLTNEILIFIELMDIVTEKGEKYELRSGNTYYWIGYTSFSDRK